MSQHPLRFPACCGSQLESGADLDRLGVVWADFGPASQSSVCPNVPPIECTSLVCMAGCSTTLLLSICHVASTCPMQPVSSLYLFLSHGCFAGGAAVSCSVIRGFSGSDKDSRHLYSANPSFFLFKILFKMYKYWSYLVHVCKKNKLKKNMLDFSAPGSKKVRNFFFNPKKQNGLFCAKHRHLVVFVVRDVRCAKQG